MDRFSTTLAALASPRRLLPIVAVVGALVAVQLYYTPDVRAAVVPLGMSLAFVILAPWSWRAWFVREPTATSWHPPFALAALLYAIEAAVVVAVFGIAIPRALDVGPTFLGDAGSLVIAGVLFVVGGWGLGRDIELELDLDHANLKALRANLDPHFMFNTLNAIAEWCAEDPKVAEDATLRLAALLRDVQDGLERRSWPLARELAVVRDFLELHRIRDRDAFTFTLPDAPPPAAEVPPLVVLSLVENAVKHGPRKGHRGAIVLRVAPHASDARMRVEIENPGPFAPQLANTDDARRRGLPRRDDGRGLALVRKRLALAYGARAHFDIRTVDDNRTLAAVTLA